jgi:hypothetical protein
MNDDDPKRRKLQEILVDCNIDESTFQIKGHESRTKEENITVTEEAIKKLIQFRDNEIDGGDVRNDVDHILLQLKNTHIALLKEEIQELLTHVVCIDETTFHVQEDVVQRRGSIAIIEEVVRKLIRFRDKLDNGDFQNDVKHKIDFIRDVHDAIINGTYFSSMEDVWESREESFDEINFSDLFDRPYAQHHSNKPQFDKNYQETIKGAINSLNDVADDSSRTPRREQWDIFGVDNKRADSAHLMPYSELCASLWYPLVHWVLCSWDEIKNTIDINDEVVTAETDLTTTVVTAKRLRIDKDSSRISVSDVDNKAERSRWNYLQRCIHGFQPSTKLNNDGSVAVNQDDDINHETQSVSSAQPSENQLTTSSKRQNYVGIKNLRTNQIYLAHSKAYLNDCHCVFIVPIMSHEEVKNWNGSGYDAIVLVRYTTALGRGEDVNNSKKKALVATVYRHIEADAGHISFATNEECQMACALFKTFILGICRSSRDGITNKFLESHLTDLYKKASTLKDPAATYIKGDQNNCPVPMCKESSTTCHVRKITFSDSNKTNKNPAPDPVLLLGKATSNWLKCHQMVVLPAYDSDDDSSCTGSSDSYDVVSFAKEMAIRGWSSDTLERSPIDNIVEVECPLGETLDESLSDDDASYA